MIDPRVRQRIPAMELAAMMEIGRQFPLPYLLLLAGSAYLLHRHVPPEVLLVWSCVYASYIAGRTLFTRAYFANATRLPVWGWRAGTCVSAACHGLILGSLAFVGLPHLPADQGMALTVAVIGVCAAGALYAALHLPALHLLTIAALLPYAIGWQLRASPGDIHPAGAVVLGLLFVFLSLNRSHHRVLQHNLLLRANQELLLDDLAHKNGQLEAAHAARTRLLATASHDLRQPVHTMGLLIAGLDADMPATELNARFAQLEHACSIVADMLGELMDLSQLESRNYPSRVKPLELDALLEQVRLTYAQRGRGKGVELRVQFSGLRVMSDLRLLRRVLFNLTGNAVRYTLSGSVSLSARAEGGDVVISIADTGPGIPPGELAHVFDDFHRLDASRSGSDESEGLGLGLSIVRRACALLGHKLSIDSVVGAGTTVRVRLSRSADAAVASAQQATAAAAPLPRHTVLVIENDLEALRALSELLAQWGHECIALASGHDLRATLASAVTISAVITDLHLDGADGLTLIGQVRHDTGRPDLPALLVTGDVSPALGRRAIQAGVVLAHKPLAPQQLRRELEALLG
jgi:signal transduction histidine kinase